MAKEKFYVTTPIYYPNRSPHIGTAYTTIATDVLARYYRLKGADVFFLTGSDEHGQKMIQAAEKAGEEPLPYIDKIVATFKEIWRKFDISYDDFIRTTEERHIKVVEKIFEKLMKQGDVYLGEYEGWYCVRCETFWPESQILEEGKCPNPECGLPINKLKEESFFFKLSKYADPLLKHIQDNPDFIKPESRRNEIIQFIKGGLQDICVSRESLEWGVKVPGYPHYVIYVWIDALINYISAMGYLIDDEKFNYWWPADIHLMAKDILRFHAVIWPAMHIALGIPLPRQVFAHGWLTLKGERISKSKGETLDTLKLIDDFGSDAIRYFLMRESTFGLDMDFSIEALIRRINMDLGNDLGNLLNRTIPMVQKYCGGKAPARGSEEPIDLELKEIALATPARTGQFIEKVEFRQALEEIWKLVTQLNKYIDTSAPWKLFKEKNQERLNTVMRNILESLRIIGLLLTPFMPNKAPRIWEQLGLQDLLGKVTWHEVATWEGIPEGTEVVKGEPMFPRIEES